MPELPEIMSLSAQMDRELKNKQIKSIEIIQPMCLNLEPDVFQQCVTGAVWESAAPRGKWIMNRTSQGWILLNLGMGGDLRLTTRDALPEKKRIIFDFEDDSCLSINFWWFGYCHYAPLDDLESHEMTAKLGPSALDLSADDLAAILEKKRGRIKNYLLDQKIMAGIGNAYVHDILFVARLHPLQPANVLDRDDIDRLANAISEGLQPSVDKGGAFYEKDLYGKPGGFTMDDILIGYKEGKPCPECSTEITKIKTGSTSSFICPSCQAIK